MFAFAIVLALLSQLTATLAFVPSGTPCVPIGTPTYSNRLDYLRALPGNDAGDAGVTTTVKTGTPSHFNHFESTRSVSAHHALETFVTMEKPNLQDLSNANRVVYTASDLLCSKSGMLCHAAEKFNVRAVHFIETPTKTVASKIEPPSTYSMMFDLFTITTNALLSSPAFISQISHISGPLIKLVHSLSFAIPLSALNRNAFYTVKDIVGQTLDILFISFFLAQGLSVAICILLVLNIFESAKLVLSILATFALFLVKRTVKSLRNAFSRMVKAKSGIASASALPVLPVRSIPSIMVTPPSEDNSVLISTPTDPCESVCVFENPSRAPSTSSTASELNSWGSTGTQDINTDLNTPELPTGSKTCTSRSLSATSTPAMADERTTEVRTTETMAASSEVAVPEVFTTEVRTPEIEESFLGIEILEENAFLEVEAIELRKPDIETASPDVEASEIETSEVKTPEIEESFLGIEILEKNAFLELETPELRTTENEDTFFGIELLEMNASLETETPELRIIEATPPVETSEVNMPEAKTPEIEDDFLGIEILENNASPDVEASELRTPEIEAASPEVLAITSEQKTPETEATSPEIESFKKTASSEFETPELRTPEIKATSPKAVIETFEVRMPKTEAASIEMPEMDENEKANKELRELLISRGRPKMIPFNYKTDTERKLDIEVSGIYSLTIGNALITKTVNMSQEKTLYDHLSDCLAMFATSKVISEKGYSKLRRVLMCVLRNMEGIRSGLKFEFLSEDYFPYLLSAQVQIAKNDRKVWLPLCWKIFMAYVDLENRRGPYRIALHGVVSTEDEIGRLLRSKVY